MISGAQLKIHFKVSKKYILPPYFMGPHPQLFTKEIQSFPGGMTCEGLDVTRVTEEVPHSRDAGPKRRL